MGVNLISIGFNFSKSNKEFNNITYNLKQYNNRNFYSDIKYFVDLVLDESKIAIGDVILDFDHFLDEKSLDDIYIGSYFGEHVFEALYLGVLWNLYIKKAVKLDPFNQEILAKLSSLRNQKDIVNSPYKTQIDEIRGLLATKFLFNLDNLDNLGNIDNVNNCSNSYNYIDENDDPNLNITLLLNYLEATGDYRESLKHLRLWEEFFLTREDLVAKSYFNLIISFASWFEKTAKKELHFYAENVEDFLNNHLKDHIGNEDILFCGRLEVEYQINLFAEES